MFRPDLKTRVLADGRIEIVDPDIETLPLLKSINPEFRIRRARLQNFSKPRLLSTKALSLPFKKDDVNKRPEEELWTIHDNAMNDGAASHAKGEVTLLDLKIELAKRALRECRLCGRECGINRFSEERGCCGLGIDSKVGECFVHIAEEAPVNPSINVNVRGCGLKCRFCQKHELLDPDGQGQMLEASLWKELRANAARSISFIGGNPDESIYAILRFLADMPFRFRKPIVWNSNGYASKVVYRLLRGVADAYIPDMKFYRKTCSRELADCDNYFDMFRGGIEEMVKQNASVFVRMLIIPGHLECCHIPLIDYLSKYKAKAKLNIMGQYCPDYKVYQHESSLNRRPERSEIEYARSYAERLGGLDWLIKNDYERK
jgi:putative pyruvate formate lyase activating enzyme